jgi:tol-pal system protein YbgF
LLLAGCADFGGPIGGNDQPVSPQEQRMQSLETRLGELVRKVDNLNLTSQTQGISSLQTEVRGLRGDVEKLHYDLDTNARRAQELYQDLDRRMTKLENESRSARLTMAPTIAHAPPVPPSQEEESTYVAVFDQLKGGHYDEAITGFKDLLQRWPQGNYADNSWYWLGKAYYAKRDYDAALQSFRTLLEKFPSSAKAPDALLEIGTAQLDKKQKDEARATLQKLIATYPGSNAAGIAKQRLEQIK